MGLVAGAIGGALLGKRFGKGISGATTGAAIGGGVGAITGRSLGAAHYYNQSTKQASSYEDNNFSLDIKRHPNQKKRLFRYPAIGAGIGGAIGAGIGLTSGNKLFDYVSRNNAAALGLGGLALGGIAGFYGADIVNSFKEKEEPSEVYITNQATKQAAEYHIY